jgi:uncharacterized membrane protein YqhA
MADHVNAGVLKVKLSMALIGISSIHLLKTFINPISTRRTRSCGRYSSTCRSWCRRS